MQAEQDKTITPDGLPHRLARQRLAFNDRGAPSLDERRADLIRLRDAIKRHADSFADAISADFGNRSRQESLLADVWPVHASLRHALRHLPRWMKPKNVPVGVEFAPNRARVLIQPLGVVGIVSPWNYPVNLALCPLVAALAAGNRVMLKPSELTPRTSELLATMLGGLFPEENSSPARRASAGGSCRRRRKI
jgi:coniferyl-aldehyde dehydrogenase